MLSCQQKAISTWGELARELLGSFLRMRKESICYVQRITQESLNQAEKGTVLLHKDIRLRFFRCRGKDQEEQEIFLSTKWMSLLQVS